MSNTKPPQGNSEISREPKAITEEELAAQQESARLKALQDAEEAGASDVEVSSAKQTSENSFSRAAKVKRSSVSPEAIIDLLVKAAPKDLEEMYAERMVSRKLSAEETRKQLAGAVLKKNGWTIADVTARLQEAEGDPDAMVDTFVFDPEIDDYVPKRVTKSELSQMNLPKAETLDMLALSHSYQGGDYARFDYFWGAPEDSRQMRLARDKGWVPVKVAADREDQVIDGLVMRGDLCLMRRPKDLAPRYEAEARARAESIMGKESDELRQLGEDLGLKVDVPDGDGFSVTEGPLDMPQGNARPEPKNGKKTFAFSKNPLYQKKVDTALALLRGQ